MMKVVLATAVAVLAAYLHADDIVHVSPEDVGPDSIVYWQGEYVGTVAKDGGKVAMAAQVVAHRNDNYQLVLYRGGLPGHGWEPDSGVERIDAGLDEGRLAFEGGDGCTYKVENGTIRIVQREHGQRGVLERMLRTSPTLGLRGPDGATVLFDGTNVDRWREGATMTDDGLLDQGARSAEKYGDIFLHVEYMLPFWEG